MSKRPNPFAKGGKDKQGPTPKGGGGKPPPFTKKPKS
jgi:hypothetical protein